MEKTKLAICIEDEEYKTRFVKCVMNHYKEVFEIHVVDDFNELMSTQNTEFEVIITGDGKEIMETITKKAFVLILQEDGDLKQNNSVENIHYIEKYQEVYKIMEYIEKVAAEKVHFVNKSAERMEQQKIGIFSLGKEMMQVPFAVLLAEVLGENSRVLMLDLQPFSGLAMEIETEDILGMEDVMSIATTQNYTRNRLAGSIGHEQKWDFIYPVKNSFCLLEGDAKIYQKVVDICQKEYVYDYIIINFGVVVSDMTEFMESCQKLYFLSEKQEERNWREKSFLLEMQCQGKEELLQKINWVEMPVEVVKGHSWHTLAKSWLWDELGDQLREQHWMENKNGAGM